MQSVTPVEAGRLPVPPQELESTWQAIRDQLRRSVTDLTYHLWLEPLEAAGMDGGSLYVRTPRHIRTLVEERYLPLLRNAAGQVLERQIAVLAVDEEWRPQEAHPASGNPRRGRAPAAELLNPKYSFDQFVIGDGNRLAHAAALAVAEQPGQAYNPLFIHGRPGLGKTHLLHAIGNYVKRFGGGLSVRYVTSDGFTNHFVQAIRAGGVEAFKAAFRDVDLLLMDDVQFLAERTRTQEEFFHTFNALYEAGCQLVVSSDRPPRDLTAFERRLSERFGAGLVAEVEPPESRVRLAILRKRAMLDGLVDVGEDTLREVAGHADASVRELEGALIRVVAYASLRGEAPTPQLARQLLMRIRRAAEAQVFSLTEIQQAVASVFDLPPESLIAQNREPRVAFARQVAMYLARELTGATLPAIGAGFGGRNHSTVLHAHRKIRQRSEADPDVAAMLTTVRRTLADHRHDRSR